MSITSAIDWLSAHSGTIIRVAVLVLVGLPLVRLAGGLVGRTLRKRFTDQSVMLARKIVTYTATAVLLVMVLRELGFRLTALLGAAGIAGVAIGFAAQTSLSNLISGIFLIWEKPFRVGDVVQLDTATGIVHSIDLLSVKLRTFDNHFIRIPNEVLVKTCFTNVTRFPVRRLDIDIGVAYKEDVDHVTAVLADVADANPYCLDEPKRLILFKGFGDSALEFKLGVWFEKADMLELRNSIMRDIKKRFDEEDIEIPFPHRSLYTGAATEPFPVRVIPDNTETPSVS